VADLEHFVNAVPTSRCASSPPKASRRARAEIRHKAVDIGVVRSVKLSEDAREVVVGAEIDAPPRALPLDSQFWVVRPRIAGDRVSA
jgi:paraquat-inducible protein B